MNRSKIRSLSTILALTCTVMFNLSADGSIVLANGSSSSSSSSDANSVLNELFGNSSGNSSGNGTSSSVGSGTKTHAKASKHSPKGSHASQTQGMVEPYYATVTSNWTAGGVKDATAFRAVIHPNQFHVPGSSLLPVSQAKGYKEPVLQWDNHLPFVELSVNVPTDALYQIRFDYYGESTGLVQTERGIEVNGTYPYFEARNVTLPQMWKDANTHFPTDPVGDQLPATPEPVRGWTSTAATDSAFLTDQPLKLHLKQGTNVIRLVNVSGSILLGNVYIESPTVIPSYASYVSRYTFAKNAPSVVYTTEAEHPTQKSSASIQATPSGYPSVTPHRAGLVTLNTLGSTSWEDGGQSVTWQIHVNQSGLYHLAFKYLQSDQINLPTFRMLELDGAVPFQEVAHIPFEYTTTWANKILSNSTGVPYEFYLARGTHRLTLTADPAPYASVIQTVRRVAQALNTLSLQIKMVTGNTLDQNRDWSLTTVLPHLVPQLLSASRDLNSAYNDLTRLSGTHPDQAQNLLVSSQRLADLALHPNTVAYRYGDLTNGSGSINESLATLIDDLPNQPLTLDKFYVYSNVPVPSPTVSWFRIAENGFVNFIESFSRDYSAVGKTGPNTVTVWVNRPREFVAMMQQLADEYFTPKTGIHVSMMVMPDPSKLTLANAAGQTPDVALGVDNATPFNMGIRGAVLNLEQFPDFTKVEKRFEPGAMLPFIFNGATYAIPESQDFWVLFYRKDILNALKLPVPKTWDDVIGMLPQLQRYGMNFYDPIAGVGGYKPFYTFLPFFYDTGGYLYNANGTTTAITNNQDLTGFKLMTQLFSVYGLPLQVPNFYSHFRSGDLPIGISNFNTYVQLISAAPELKGLWGIAPMPGMVQPNGKILRYAPGTGQADMIFAHPSHKAAAWEFLKWWTSTPAQVQFENMMETIYGPSFAWNSSNVAAFRQLPWPKADIQTIVNQWQWLQDNQHVPGDYMVERGISNAWNEVVFNGMNPRMALENAAIDADREIKQQLGDLGFVNAQGKPVENISLPPLPSEMNKGEGKRP